ncbi:zinc finger protein [Amycolatopsis samaneae]|uniref:Zinc finger protein n=1 Tax=Amycolatopsis samaneae TaxID=664691 RepID=A0ABW5GVR9_9PSEU
MIALIYVDTRAILPVVDGTWHRARFTHVPSPGEPITTLCGVSAVTEFELLDRRDVHGVPRQCWSCDLLYRRQHGIDVWPGHPGL